MTGVEDIETSVGEGNGFTKQFQAVYLKNNFLGGIDLKLYNLGLLHRLSFVVDSLGVIK